MSAEDVSSVDLREVQERVIVNDRVITQWHKEANEL